MSGEALRKEDALNAVCPWSSKPIADDSLTTYRGRTVGFCNTGCRNKFEKAVSAFDAAIGSQDG